MPHSPPFYKKSFPKAIGLSLAILIALWLLGYQGIAYVFQDNEISRSWWQLLFSRTTLLLALGFGVFVAIKNKVWRQIRLKANAFNLSIFRVIYFGFFSLGALFFLPRLWQQTTAFAALPPSARSEVAFANFLPSILPHSSLLITLCVVLFFVAMVAACIGYKTKWAILLFSFCAFYLLGLPNFYGKINHNHHIIWFALVLAFSPCHEMWSVDAWLQKRKGIPITSRNALEYQLPFIILWSLMGLIYFFPGFWKLWTSGLDWALSSNLKFQMQYKWLQLDQWTPFFRIDQYPLLYRSAGLFVLLFEIFFCLFIWHPKTRIIAICSGLIFHFSSWLFMDIFFVVLVLSYSSFIDWESLLVKKSSTQPPALSLSGLKTSFKAQKITWLVGILLLGCNTVFGLAHVHSWPFTMYPTFENIQTAATKTLVYRGRKENGEYLDLSKRVLIQHYSSARLWALEEDIIASIGESEGAYNKEILAHLMTLLSQEYPSLETIRISISITSIDQTSLKEIHESLFVDEISVD
ncbi:MAG: HTTM domain-containing protein [Dokdonia sp.]|jgi:hypothetical protein|nr:hypothetical protein [Cytophagaceae bacterium]